jgi:hypothetical protein
MRSAIVSILVFAASALIAQEGTRQLWNTEFLDKRPAGAARPAAAAPVYKSAKPLPPAPKNGTQTMVGITLWRLRDPKPAEPAGTRLLVLEKPGGQSREEVPERIDADSVLSVGDHVRLNVEVPSSGYLYVIDREEYADGTTSDPYLIYPNWQTRPGDNVVAPGRIIEIPDRRETQNVFLVQPQRPDQVAEVLSMLITNSPLPDLRIGDHALKLGRKMYEDWRQQYGAQVERLDLVGGAGSVWTSKENDSGANHNQLLTQGDAPPQTLYRVSAKPGSPVLVQVPLRIKK